jgi:serine/threonine-protein kinase
MEMTAGLVLAGKLRLDEPIASGGMGHVWLGRHLLLDLPIALKFMDASLIASPEARARFEREARAAAQLRSQHIVQILDYGLHEGAPYIVMEHLVGEDLRTRLERQKKLSLKEISTIVGEVAKGLKLAHDAGIVHRDLKPGNVFLARVGDDEIAKILDFGVAKSTDARTAETTTTGRLLGSPEYMSPEQARGGVIDPRSDLWSLGVIVFRALTGKRPFTAAHVGDLLVKICADPIPRATAIAPELPPAIEDFFERALCRSPDGRFASAKGLSDALAAIADGSIGVTAPPISAPQASAATVVERSEATVSLAVPAPEKSVEAPPRSRAWIGVVAFGALVAVIAIAATQSARWHSVAAPESATAVVTVAPTPSSNPTLAVSTAQPTATAVVVALPSATALPTAQVAATPPPKRPTRPAAPAVDPKYGLPVPK